jgi:hypothetical protein
MLRKPEEGTRRSCAIGSDYKADAALSVCCPNAGDSVQAWAANEPEDEDLT